MGFKVGQKVVCIDGVNRITTSGPDKGREGFGPKPHQIVKVSLINDEGFIGFDEYGNQELFDPAFFRPLDYDFVEEVIKQVTPKKQEA